IINGGQTCITIHRTLGTQSNKQYSNDAFVLVRLYQLPSDNVELITRITFATNSQNPVDLRDLRSNDAIQQRLEIDISQMGYTYQRKRMDKKEKKGDDITSAIAAEAILSVWRSTPQRAKFLTREHFGQLYSKIFTNELTGAQVIIATLIYRFAENKRRRPPEDAPQFVSYASCFIAMQIGKYLLADLQIDIGKLTHNNFNEAKQIFEDRAEQYFSRAVKVIDEALNTFYREAPSLQLLSATFRRGDLIAIIEQIERQS
ncbi:MAG: AIPR family protein, partial [Candidatus Magnetominusculus sp. LBB02]|nr:AIPR family protein [Candidatus Magnetominusculus sp. LBB02]